MTISIPSASKQLSEDQIFNAINKNYSQMTKVWFNYQMNWLRVAYQSFHDHDKFLIIQYLVFKTLNFLSPKYRRKGLKNNKNRLRVMRARDPATFFSFKL